MKSPTTVTNQSLPEENQRRIVKLNIDDHVILQTDENYQDLLWIAIPGKNGDSIEVQFPLYGDWDLFTARCSEMLQLMSLGADNLQLPDDVKELKEMSDVGSFQRWAFLQAIALRAKPIREKVEDIFFRFLRPVIKSQQLKDYLEEQLKEAAKEVAAMIKYNKKWFIRNVFRNLKKEIPDEYDLQNEVIIETMKVWMRRNLDIITIAKMFTAILCVNDFIEKKTRFILTMTFQRVISPPQSNTPQKPGVSASKTSANSLLSPIDF